MQQFVVVPLPEGDVNGRVIVQGEPAMVDPSGSQWPELLTVKMAARYLGVSESGLRLWVKSGRFPVPLQETGGCRRFSRRRLAEWLASGQAAAASVDVEALLRPPATRP